MREIVLDTETTGLDPETGDRIVEIGAIELLNHLPTGRTFHQYLNPQRDMPAGAFAVHGLSAEFLADKALFAAVALEFLEFIKDAKLVIHNASFDMKFLNAELVWAGHAKLPHDQAVDTLEIARRKFPGAQNSLDALCRRFGVDNSAREKHGALLDSELLAEVYLELIGGRQPGLMLGAATEVISGGVRAFAQVILARKSPLPPRLSEAELAAHEVFVASLGPNAGWNNLGKVT
jgi:DNA polymerase III subunit epsilon